MYCMSYIGQSLISLKKIFLSMQPRVNGTYQGKGVNENKGSGALRVMLYRLTPCRPAITPMGQSRAASESPEQEEGGHGLRGTGGTIPT